MMAQETYTPADRAVPPGPAARVLPFSGRLTFGPESERRFFELRELIEQGVRTFVLDLSQVPDIDSAGIGFLVMCFTTVLRAGGELKLAAPNNRVLYVLLITRLDTVFPIFEDVGRALRPQPSP